MFCLKNPDFKDFIRNVESALAVACLCVLLNSLLSAFLCQLPFPKPTSVLQKFFEKIFFICLFLPSSHSLHICGHSLTLKNVAIK